MTPPAMRRVKWRQHTVAAQLHAQSALKMCAAQMSTSWVSGWALCAPPRSPPCSPPCACSCAPTGDTPTATATATAAAAAAGAATATALPLLMLLPMLLPPPSLLLLMQGAATATAGPAAHGTSAKELAQRALPAHCPDSSCQAALGQADYEALLAGPDAELWLQVWDMPAWLAAGCPFAGGQQQRGARLSCIDWDCPGATSPVWAPLPSPSPSMPHGLQQSGKSHLRQCLPACCAVGG